MNNTCRRLRRSAAVHPRVVLCWAVVAALVAGGMYAVAPWILPARVLEGPLVQMATENAVALVWYTTRPTACRALVTVGDQQLSLDARGEGSRYVAHVTGLSPGTSYPYEIRAGNRRLVGGLSFQTNRAADQRFNFLVFGDSGSGSRAQYLLGGLMARTLPPADFLLHTGDLVYPDGLRERYEARFFAPYRSLLARVNFWPCLGNHDVQKEDGRAPAYESVFELPANGPSGEPPDHHYWFDCAAARVAVINSDVDEAALAGRVAPWLREIMADPRPRWRFVAFHHPPYTGGKYQPDERIQRTLVPLLETTGVDVVFSGHDHTYQRTHPLHGGQVAAAGEGVVYVVTGAGGASLYEPRNPSPDYLACFESTVFSFTQISVDGTELTGRQISSTGQTLDQWILRKTTATTAPSTSPAATE